MFLFQVEGEKFAVSPEQPTFDPFLSSEDAPAMTSCSVILRVPCCDVCDGQSTDSAPDQSIANLC